MQEMTEAQSRFADVWLDAAAAEAAAREQRKVERSYRLMLAATDDVLAQLERRNLSGQRDLDQVLRRDIDRMLARLSPAARSRFPAGVSEVQEALDGVFEVQEELLLVLQRMVHWDRLLTAPWDGLVGGADDLPERRTA
jgi:hypothetical protein